MWVEFVVGSRLAPKVFLLVLRFSYLFKNQHSKFQFDQDRGHAWKPALADVASSLNIVRIPSKVYKCLEFNCKLKCKNLSLLLSFGRSFYMIDLHIYHPAYLLFTLCKKNSQLAVFMLETHCSCRQTWANICSPSGYEPLVWRRAQDALRVVRRSRRISKDSSSRRVTRLVPVFILEMHNQTGYKGFPNFVQTGNASLV